MAAGGPDSRPVVVTGGAGGIGSAVVAALASQGHPVAVIDRIPHDPPDGDGAVIGIVADVADSAAVQAAGDRIRAAVDDPWALINVAGDNVLRPTLEVTDDEWHYLINVNLSSAFFCCRQFLPGMVRRGEGRIVNFSSIFGLRAQPADAAYSAAKAGIIGLTRSLAAEFAPHNVTVNAIAPVVTLTPRLLKLPREHLAAQVERIPLGRPSSVTDVVETVRFLLSAGGSFYTGQTFSPNGGELMP